MTGAPSVVRGRVGLQQRVLPDYRAGFFDRLGARCPDGLSVIAGDPRPGEAILSAAPTEKARWERTRNVHLMSGQLYLCWQPDLSLWLERWDPSVLVLEANPRYVSNWAAAAWMRARGRPVVGWGLGAPGARGWAAGVWRRFLRRLDGVIAYSRRGAREYAAAGMATERIWMAPNAVTWAPGAIGQRTIPRDRAPRLISVGRLQARKRVDVLLEACAGLEPAPEVWIVGDGPARPVLEALASTRGVGARFYGAVRGQALDDLLKAADVFVLPGTGGLAVQQAMANGLPVIVAEGDGTQEDLVTAENGWLVPAGNAGALREALQEALAQPERLIDMGRASHRRVATQFNLDVMVEVFVEALNAVKARA